MVRLSLLAEGRILGDTHDSCCSPVSIYADYLLWEDLMGTMWVFLGHSAITKKSAAVDGTKTWITEFTTPLPLH